MKIGIIGLGLIGGSLARAFRVAGTHEVVGIDRDPSTRFAAEAEGIHCSERVSKEWLQACDVILIALSPRGIRDFLADHGFEIAAGTLVIDTCGVKRVICEIGFEQAREYGFHFIGGHPMAGKEKSGFAAATPTLFAHAVMLLTPKSGEQDEVVARADALFTSIGFARTLVTTPEKHDEVIAITSQLAHVVSNAYVKSPRAQEFRGYSAGSFADLTRVATLDPELWTQLFLANADNLALEIDTLVKSLQEYRRALKRKDARTLAALLREGRDCKENLLKTRN